ncbi:LLM class flavin-dependent oxidoreductase [Dactylosporangium vinaceum]|uniref:LLM class flavin-dependent oxidoreductase n=1 Tax=Dactylosporangium vinaceum TaxID=53362 RepID=A0ABV5M320_9ACTN|nr:LLM class flavin-dependent oxidoreductase [Dactylosporangium vinaceum]UAB99812.1 LLM class flavin-dependent oxidoreductase [Dactylosporangium vinaceum]
MPPPFKLGFLTHVHGYGKPATQVYAELLDTIAAAEDLGYDGVFLAQHHFRHDGARLPSPLVLLAAAARRTSRIELGTAVVTLPLEDPLRLAEDAAVLDGLSGGRVQLGLGTGGANAATYPAFGFANETLDERYDSGLAVVHGALAGAPIGESGLVLHPPAPGLRERVWQSTSRPDKAARIAAAGDGLLLGTFIHRPEAEQLPLIEAYRAAWAGPGAPRIGATRAVFPGASRAAALADLGRGLKLFREQVRPFADLSGYDDEQLAERINVHYGTPADIVDSLRRDPALLGHAGYFFPVVQHEASSAADDIRRLEIIATQIAPELGWRPAP